MIGNLEKPNHISLYIHVPFCAKKCPYCHFYVQKTRDESVRDYLKALEIEIQKSAIKLQGREIVSIYFGGGTPSQLEPKLLLEILNCIEKLPVSFSPDCEITLEANPDDISKDYLKKLSQSKVNRLSFGVQSLDEKLLTILSRTHSANKAIETVETAYSLGFDNISIDLMYELPHQTLESFEKTLDRVVKLPITHLSLYNLIFEPKTSFYKNYSSLAPHLPTDTEAKKMLDLAILKLKQTNLNRYEISAFCREGYHSKHNTGYWLGREFLGFGPSAFSYYNKQRYQNVCHLKKYSQKLFQGEDPMDFHEQLDPFMHLKELTAIRLRLLEGIDYRKTRDNHPELKNIFEELLKEGFLEEGDSNIKLSEKGLLFYDDVGTYFV